jgi:integrase
MTTEQLLTDWLENYEKERVKPRTYSRYQGLLTLHIIPELGDVDITELGRRQIQEFLTRKKKDGNVRSGEQLSATSTNLMLTVFNLAFEYAYDMELVEENPCTRLKRAPENGRTIEAFSKEEQRRLETQIAVEDDRRLFGIRLCLYTGLRIGELLGLEWQDVDLDEGIITITKTVYRDKSESGTWQLCVDQPKTRASVRRIPLPPYIKEQLTDYRRSATSEYVVENKKGERMSIRSYQYMFEKLTERAGVRKLNFHALRHTFATRAVECGMDIKTLSEIMGHGSASVTLNRYAHSMMDTKIEMMNKLPRII